MVSIAPGSYTITSNAEKPTNSVVIPCDSGPKLMPPDSSAQKAWWSIYPTPEDPNKCQIQVADGDNKGQYLVLGSDFKGPSIVYSVSGTSQNSVWCIKLQSDSEPPKYKITPNSEANLFWYSDGKYLSLQASSPLPSCGIPITGGFGWTIA